VKTRSWIGRMTFPAVAGVIALTVTLLAAAGPSVAQTMSMHESGTRGGDAHHGADGDHGMHSSGEHGDRDHHSPHHFRGRPNEPYYIYPYNPWYGWNHRHYATPSYPAPSYWYYCRSYAAYYPYVVSCPESWVVVPAS